MLSHLRFHRRGGASNPTSPCPDQTPTSPPGNSSSSSNPASHLPLDSGSLSVDRRPASSSSSALPPTLPPITRVTSAETEPVLEARRDGDMGSLPESRSHQPSRSPYTGDSGFLGGVALRKYRRDKEAHATEATDSSKGLSSDGNSSKSRPSLAPLQTPAPIRPPPQKAITTSFSTPTDLQNSSGPAGRRPAGTRLASDLPSLTPTTTNLEQQKPKKGLPFLKNPMSTLLMRRKTSQHVPDLLPLPLRRNEEPMYDPRIKGTRVHDFSAPRRKTAVNKTTPYGPPPIDSPAVPEQDKTPQYLTASKQTTDAPTSLHSQRSNAAESLNSSSSQLLKHAPSSTSDTQAPKDAALPSTPDAPPVPPKDDDNVDPAHPMVSQVSRLIDDVDATLSSSTGSTKGGRSRQASLSGMSVKEIPTAVPRHMKSTSSRFSFDMIGAAGQEKLLEERHRQRELEKKTADVPAQRDSRFDDFDDDFDYDAMMDDDGLEEPIPMANEDYEEDAYLEEEINMVGDDVDEALDDPDNDQENFSGFVFQRSNPTSSLTSPRSAGFLPTPRDADGKVIGFAMSKDTPGLLSPDFYANTWQTNSEAAGLGIQGLDVSSSTMMSKNAAAFQQNQALPPVELSQPLKEDNLYFDDGMIGFENQEFAEDLAAPPEWDEAPFDESIFDNNDTDQFGRPVPGAFAQAQSQRRAAIEEAVRRESDLTSRLSAHSAGSPSTAHTSLSVDNRKHDRSDDQTDLRQESSQEESSAASKVPSPNEINMVAYQAALAAAAHKAAASGKFERGSSPAMDDSFMSEDAYSHSAPFDDSYRNGGYDDYGYEDMADFEADDDDIVAEANASALANDSDGWYGQEFGFYSAPVQQGVSHNSSSSSVDYEYANGGFFGPKGGLDRTISGRMVSREPNLTPITERSEYSNRNSIMSMGLPGFSSGTPLQSPGLAQLALLGDRGDEMSLSALLKLRSRAWGGSQISLASSREGSPRSERGDHSSSPWGPTYFSPIATHARKNSILSTFTADSEGGSISGSPTLTNHGFQGFMYPPNLAGLAESREDMKLPPSDLLPQLQDLEATLSPVSDTTDPQNSSAMVSPLEFSKYPDNALPPISPRRSGAGHRHKGSAESISYTKEEDSGATRWVMERRRTGEFGQVEILEREVVEGGRI